MGFIIDNRLRDRQDLDKFRQQCIALNEKIDALRLEMQPFVDELDKLETEHFYKSSIKREKAQVSNLKKQQADPTMIGQIEADIQKYEAEEARRKEVQRILRNLSAKTEPLFKEQAALHEKISKMRVEFEIEYLQPQFRLDALKRLEDIALSAESQVTALDVYDF